MSQCYGSACEIPHNQSVLIDIRIAHRRIRSASNQDCCSLLRVSIQIECPNRSRRKIKSAERECTAIIRNCRIRNRSAIHTHAHGNSGKRSCSFIRVNRSAYLCAKVPVRVIATIHTSLRAVKTINLRSVACVTVLNIHVGNILRSSA